MTPRTITIVALLTMALAAVVYGGLRGAGVFGGDGELPAIPAGDQEVAWIHAATSGPAWERFVTGVHRAAHDWPKLQVDDTRAFLDQTTAVPELVLTVDGCASRLLIRWYKLTSETGPVQWVRRLAGRDRPPLAFIGGGSSDRALDLARALADQKEWGGPSPLLLITTATANTVVLDPEGQASVGDIGPTPLMKVYSDRSFRFCFTNEQMAQAVVDFVWSQPDLHPFGNPLPALGAVAAAALDPWAGVGLLAAHAAECPPSAAALEWDDDPYSIDLSNQFKLAFHQPNLPEVRVTQKWSIPYSVGGFYRPNEVEALAAERLVRALRSPLERQLLVLPTTPAAARRVLRALTGAAPLIGNSIVAIGGDSMNINTVYRDADIAWNIRAVPVPIVFFTHQNPVAWDVEPGAPKSGPETDPGRLLPPNGTDDVLLHADLVRRLTQAAFQTDRGDTPAALLASADDLRDRLKGRQPAYFDPIGDRLGGRGEFVLVLRPHILDPDGPAAQVSAAATLDVWTRGEGAPGPGPNPSRWQPVKRLVIDHGRGSRPVP